MSWSLDRDFLANFRIPAVGVAVVPLFLNISRVDSMKKDKEENGEVEKTISGFHALISLEFILRILEQRRSRFELLFSIHFHPGRL